MASQRIHLWFAIADITTVGTHEGAFPVKLHGVPPSQMREKMEFSENVFAVQPFQRAELTASWTSSWIAVLWKSRQLMQRHEPGATENFHGWQGTCVEPPAHTRHMAGHPESY